MGIVNWANRTVAEYTRRKDQTPEVPVMGDDGPAGAARVGRLLRRLPGESQGDAARRNFDNAKNDLWEAAHLDEFATLIADENPGSSPKKGNLERVAGVTLVGAPFLAAEVTTGVGRLFTAGARTLAGLFHLARG